MPSLFETFVAQWLEAHLDSRYALKKQQRAPLEGSDWLAFQIDLVLSERHTGRVLAVLDTKYKYQDLPEEEDIQQVVAYAVRLGAPRAWLVYPSEEAPDFRIVVGQVEVRSLAFDLGSADLEAAGQGVLEKVCGLPGF
jgi:5-methylcytosine-specific restriction endonuclease McrBC regulatory subunit McrC